MKRHARTAYEALKKMGVPMYVHEGESYHFLISGEENYTTVWADYWNEFGLPTLDDFGVDKRINAVLEKNGLFAEWQNPGCLGVYDA